MEYFFKSEQKIQKSRKGVLVGQGGLIGQEGRGGQGRFLGQWGLVG